MTFKTGDLVKLKSGGPTLTVNSVSSDGTSVQAVWYSSAENTFKWTSFRSQALVTAGPEAKDKFPALF